MQELRRATNLVLQGSSLGLARAHTLGHLGADNIHRCTTPSTRRTSAATFPGTSALAGSTRRAGTRHCRRLTTHTIRIG